MLTPDNLPLLTTQVAAREPALQAIVDAYGPPPLWTRPPGFATLLRIILEQQVSLASARAAYDKLVARLGEVSPAALLTLTDEELRACYFSRQKTAYARHLATSIVHGALDLDGLTHLPDEDVRARLLPLKGIGHWTVDIYLLMALQRADVFPIGDLAAVNSLKLLGLLAKEADRAAILAYAEAFRPYRSVLTMLLWHWYIREKGIVVG